LYHYYVPAYLSAKLARGGHRLEKSFFISFMFNYLYETADEASPFTRLAWEPGTIRGKHTLRDIYMGYRGALRGIGLADSSIAPAEFMALMSSNPQQAIIAILQDRALAAESIGLAGSRKQIGH
jgi:hypothetical protein